MARRNARVLTRDALEDAGIEFLEDVAPLGLFEKESPQARILLQYLLDFQNIISKETFVRVRLVQCPVGPVLHGTDVPVKSETIR
jgi:hypothetical protein